MTFYVFFGVFKRSLDWGVMHEVLSAKGCWIDVSKKREKFFITKASSVLAIAAPTTGWFGWFWPLSYESMNHYLVLLTP